MLPSDPAAIAVDLAEHWLIQRGGFHFASDEAAPVGPSGSAARSVLLVGQAGAGPWPHFMAWRERKPSDLENPLDSWSRGVIGGIAERFGARAVSPSDKPYLPFQQWAMRAEGLRPSPLGVLMHPRYGLWHAYRGALLFADLVPLPEAAPSVHLCDQCIDKPCMTACPVNAHSPQGFAYQSCLAHVRGPRGGLCRSGGCLDRNACPYGAAYRYSTEAQAFHMAAFAR